MKHCIASKHQYCHPVSESTLKSLVASVRASPRQLYNFIFLRPIPSGESLKNGGSFISERVTSTGR